MENSPKKRWLSIIISVIVLISIHLYIVIVAGDYVDLLDFLARVLGSITASLIGAFIPVGILYSIIYRKDIKNRRREFVLGLIIGSILISFLIMKGGGA